MKSSKKSSWRKNKYSLIIDRNKEYLSLFGGMFYKINKILYLKINHLKIMASKIDICRFKTIK